MNTSISLFKTLPVPDRHQTQLAYRVKYWPMAELSPAAKELIKHQKKVYMRKQALLDACNDELNILNHGLRKWHIVWAYNNMPTQQEWDRCGADRFISVELRTSPAIADYSVAILSWELPSERLIPHKQGEI
jgi:hypothetical protein